ncbi:MAG: glycoside hydrolase family 2 [Dysgonamonadaceae bacterium]|jgi:beta-galactosidase|nr:glycoside hydrolase family 2 [Dysgonamonadaceae bacterium]
MKKHLISNDKKNKCKIYTYSAILILALNCLTVSAQDGRLYYEHVFAPSEGYVNRLEKPLRKEICLNGRWDFQAVALPQSYRQGRGVAPELTMPEANKWDKTQIKIPSPWNINAFANRNIEGPDHRNYPSYPKEWENVKMAWMRKSVTIPSDWTGERILLHFEAVAGQTQVLVNGKKAAENFDLFLPFDADITDLVKTGETAEILVGVRSQSLFEDNSTKGRRIVPAGSMWGYLVNGIWQDVYLLAVPKISISNVYIKPLVSKNRLEIDVTIDNTTGKATELDLTGTISEWINKAGTDINSAPVPSWELEKTPSALANLLKLKVPAGQSKNTVAVEIKQGVLELWTPEHPNLYGITFRLSNKSATIDLKYERFGWREWTFEGGKQLLNGKVYQLKGDSWHFMGVPQLTRRYAYAWFSALKDANANAVRPHAQVYPRFYFDVADEMGICILAETANWASDGGPKMDSPLFWENSKDHLRRMVIRDRNHPSVFGWSVSNENKPVILNVFNKPEWMTYQKQAWKDWVEIVRENDSTRPWISSDGEEDGEGILPATVGHYGGENSLKQWAGLGKPWGVGETSMAYYGTPEQVSKFNGERAYESMEGRMEGLAYECYRLIKQQRDAGALYASVFNIAWYAVQPLPFGKRDQSAPPSLDDGIWFAEYSEGQPGVQPERMGSYCSTFNPGYDPTLPLYRTWPMFDAIKAANAGAKAAWSKWAEMPVKTIPEALAVAKPYSAVLFYGKTDSPVKQIFEKQNVTFISKTKQVAGTIIIIDGKYVPSIEELAEIKAYISKGADIWLWSPEKQSIGNYQTLLPAKVVLEDRRASSFIPEHKSWLKNTVNSDFYFSEIQTEEASNYGLSGDFVNEGEVLLNACKTNWRRWNKRAEELKTASVLRSEYETKGSPAVFVRYPSGLSTFYVSALDNFTSSEKGYNTLRKILINAGIATSDGSKNESLLEADGKVKLDKLLMNLEDGRRHYKLWVYSPRPLDDLLLEPDMPKLAVEAVPQANISLNGKRLNSLNELPLKQGWNQFDFVMGGNTGNNSVRFICENHPEFLKQLQTSIYR